MRKLAILLWIPLFVHSCTKGDCTGKTTISYSLMEEFGGKSCALDTAGFATANLNYIVLDEVTMGNILACDSLPDIDFSNYTLLIGSYLSDIDLSFRDQAVIRDCEAGLVTYRISFESEGNDSSMLVNYHAVIPKAPDGYITDFEIKIWQLH